MTYCELAHEVELQAISRVVLTCPECVGRWEILICADHGHTMNQLIARGETLACKCGTEFAMLYNVMFGVV